MNQSSKTESQSDQFGAFFGVFLPSVTLMFGVILYLRLSWILGHVGPYKMTTIVGFSSLITLITVLSLSAVVTNMRIGGGGVYYVISRSFGVEMGSAIGLSLYATQVMLIAVFTMGFVELAENFFPSIDQKMLGLSVVSILFLLAMTSSRAVLKAQLGLFILMATTLTSVFCGERISLESVNIFEKTADLSFWQAFALFFPAVTGVEAAVAMSGNLKNPNRSLPLGCIGAVLFGLVIYLSMVWFLDSHAPQNSLCRDQFILFSLSRFPALVYAGVLTTILASVLVGFLAAPRILQAIAKDGLLPEKIGVGFGEEQNPWIAGVITYAFVAFSIYCGNLNLLISVTSMFILIAYGMLNLATSLEEMIESPNWRPKFCVPSSISLFGAVLCLIAMFMIDPGTSFCALFFVTLIYVIMRRRKLSSDFDDIRNGILMFFSRFAIYRLSYAKPSLRTWRPNFLVFSEGGGDSMSMMQFVAAVSRTKGFLTMASIQDELATADQLQGAKRQLIRMLKSKKIQALVEVSSAKNFNSGVKKFITSYGLGPLTPDTVVLSSNQFEKLLNLEAVTQQTRELKRNLLIIRDNQEVMIDRQISKIDIWWDEKERGNNDLMLVLAQMLQRNPDWRKATICLKSIAKDEIAREARLKYFEQFVENSRMEIEAEVFVSSEPVEKQCSLIEHFSSSRDLVLVSLRSKRDDESDEEYHNDFIRLNRDLKDIPLLVHVQNGHCLEFSKIFRTEDLL